MTGVQTCALPISGSFTGTFIGDGSQLTGLNVPPAGMALIPAGVFVMGNTNADANIGDATPVTASVSAFYMDVNEVTLSRWQSVYFWALEHGYSFSNAGQGKGPNHPVHTISWFDAVKWCNARSEQSGKTPVYYSDAGLTQVFRSGTAAVQIQWSEIGRAHV